MSLESVPGRDGAQHRGTEGAARTLFALAWVAANRAGREPVAGWDRAQLRAAARTLTSQRVAYSSSTPASVGRKPHAPR